MTEFEFDPSLLDDFVVESQDLLDEYLTKLIELEKNPEGPDLISAIFRAAHTLKGSSAFFNLTHIKNFAHKLENLLDEIRNKTRKATPEVIDILLTGGQHLKSMFDRLGVHNYSVSLTQAEDAFLTILLTLIEKKPTPPPSAEEILKIIKEITDEFKKTSRGAEKLLLKIDSLLTDFGLISDAKDFPIESPIELPIPGESLPSIETPNDVFIKDIDGVDLQAVTKTLNDLMDQAATSGQLEDDLYAQALAQFDDFVESHALTTLREPLSSLMEDFQAIRASVGFDALLIKLLKEKQDDILLLLKTPEPAPIVDVSDAEKTAGIPTEKEEPPDQTTKIVEKTPLAKGEFHERKTMRIDEEKVDGFMNYVGELIVTSETFTYLQKMIEHEKVNPRTIRAFKNASQGFRELSADLQESLMEIRKVPIKNLLQKVNMMVRELSHQLKKNIRVEIEGHEVQVDKSIAERLEGPLVHVVRNSLDHGLESPAERESAGKASEGCLKVTASADREFFYLIVNDDGKGINPDSIKRSAVEKGFITSSQAANLSQKDALNLIFAAGFSTASEITEVSGRGVGMDVVRTNISQLNGTINVDSVVGHGTTIIMKIPLSVTLQVVKALLVRVGHENYIISLDDIVESLRPSPNDLTTVEGRGEVILRRGQIFPLIRLYEVFEITPEFTDPSQAILVVVQTPQGRFGLMVDQVIGQQQIVVKELVAQFKKLTFISGSATLGDGRLGLVLNAEGVVKLALGIST
ncbi:MAG: chemotaxis protein CheA [Deltaproteobacteria bacterium]|nr:chemotaxis protein CheA [Deltaproteobacteria bacterium]